MESVAILILSGQHIGYLPTHFAAAYVQRGLMVAINPRELNFDFTFHLVTHKLNDDDILQALVGDMLTAIFRKIALCWKYEIFNHKAFVPCGFSDKF